MAFSFQKILLVLSMIISIEAQVSHTSIQLMTEALEWTWTMSVYNELSREEEQSGGLIGGLYLGKQCIITSRTELSQQIKYLAHLVLEGPTIPTIVLEPGVLYSLTLEAALESRTARDRSVLSF